MIFWCISTFLKLLCIQLYSTSELHCTALWSTGQYSILHCTHYISAQCTLHCTMPFVTTLSCGPVSSLCTLFSPSSTGLFWLHWTLVETPSLLSEAQSKCSTYPRSSWELTDKCLIVIFLKGSYLTSILSWSLLNHPTRIIILPSFHVSTKKWRL